MTFHNVLVATDLSEHAEAVIPVAIDIGQHSGAKETLLYAADVIDLPEWSPPSEYQRFAHAALQDDRKRLEALRERIAAAGVDVTTEVIDAVPARGILDTAERHKVDLIIVGTHGRTGLGRFLIGSVAENVVRHSRTNVLVARAAPPHGIRKRILVPTDFSDSAANALARAAALVEPGGHIVLLHVWSLPASAKRWPDDPKGPGSLATSLRDTVAATGERLARELLERHDKGGFTIEAEHVEASPREGIQARIAQGDIDLVIMGSHGRRGAARWLLGSVAEATVRYSPCSVLVVRS